jgi:hypothetical protein
MTVLYWISHRRFRPAQSSSENCSGRCWEALRLRFHVVHTMWLIHIWYCGDQLPFFRVFRYGDRRFGVFLHHPDCGNVYAQTEKREKLSWTPQYMFNLLNPTGHVMHQ